MIGDELKSYTYEYLLSLALSRVPDDVDKRQGAIIFDTISATMYRAADLFMSIVNVYYNTFLETASGEYLDQRVRELGITRLQATYAIRLGQFLDANGMPVYVPTGSRFSTISTTAPVNYVVTSPYSINGVEQAGYYELTCETAGTIGNDYIGPLVNISFIQGIATAELITVLVPARDTETDEELRRRAMSMLGQKAFGGNIADYKEKVMEIAGIGAVQVYPVWDGGGTVKLSIVDPSYNPVSDEFIHDVQVQIDPENADGETGTGLGIAPIGHKVTVVTPTQLIIDINATIALQPGFTIGQVTPAAIAAISNYIATVRSTWGSGDQYNRYFVSVYRSQIISLLVSILGVANVTSVTLNGADTDLFLTEDGITQQLPVLGQVNLSE